MESIECSICTEELPLRCFTYDNPTDLFQNSCGHQFHRTCLSRWCQTKNNCPICRKNNVYTLSKPIHIQNGFIINNTNININDTYNNNNNIIIDRRNILYLNENNENNLNN